MIIEQFLEPALRSSRDHKLLRACDSADSRWMIILEKKGIEPTDTEGLTVEDVPLSCFSVLFIFCLLCSIIKYHLAKTTS